MTGKGRFARRAAPAPRALLCVIGLGALPIILAVQAPSQWGFWQIWGDQGDGTYRNPVMPADFSDLDAVRVGNDYYAISSTLHMSPGMAVLHSKDMVNWGIIGHVLPDLTVLGPEYRWDRMKRFGRGVWAGTIRNHAGKFRVFFGTPDEGFFMSSASDPAGPWTAPYPLLKSAGWDDCTVLWDDDGKAYFLGTHFADGYKSYMMPMTADGRRIDRSRALLVNEGRGREASKLLKRGGWYYIIFSEHGSQPGRYVVARRARHPMGPWSEVRQLTEPGVGNYEPNQGGIIEAPSGRYYFLTHHGRQSWEGRAASLLPVSWIDDWPIIGDATAQGIGTMSWRGRKPIPGSIPPALVISDEFASRRLRPQWEWNHQPKPGSWSLSARAGWFRLQSFRPLRPGDLDTTANIPSQRSMRTPRNAVTAKFDLSHMTDEQHAGLAHIARSFGAIGVGQTEGRRSIEYLADGKIVRGPSLSAAILWLRSTWGSDGSASFAYSTDGQRFQSFGPAYQMTHAYYRGDRTGLYSYTDQRVGGWIDVDYFRYAYDH